MTEAIQALIDKLLEKANGPIANYGDYGEGMRTALLLCVGELKALLHAGEVPQPSMADAAEMLWVVLANVSGGDWTKQTQEWQEAAARWRDNYFAAVKAGALPPVQTERTTWEQPTMQSVEEWEQISTCPRCGLVSDGPAACRVHMDEACPKRSPRP